jgi:flavin reductase (DIM6/NTAB) family NADH-FMN oxidoreductase RutF
METIRLERGAAQVAPDTFKAFMGSFYTGVTVVTSIDGTGRPHGLTCNSMVSVALDPPTLLVCLNKRCGTLTAVRQSGFFAVNLMAERGQAAAELFASPAPDRFGAVEWERGARTGMPVLTEDAFATAGCAVTGMHWVGDHAVVFGRVLELTHEPESPLVYGKRAFSGPPVPNVTNVTVPSAR